MDIQTEPFLTHSQQHLILLDRLLLLEMIDLHKTTMRLFSQFGIKIRVTQWAKFMTSFQRYQKCGQVR